MGSRDSAGPGCAALVLAAGGSRRLGRPKQLVEIGATTLVRHAAQAALECGAAPVAVVLGSHAQEVWAALEGLAVERIDNPRWEEGMGSSIRAGIRTLGNRAVDSVVIVPCDQPGLTAAHLIQLVEAHRRTGHIAATGYPDGPGAPAVFGLRCFALLGSLAGDTGARTLLRSGLEPVVVVDNPLLIRDLDTPMDLEDLR
jgi:CTP:molybdopterin cytidylyltransferase MocA